MRSARIALAMIVRDESAVISRALNSVKDLIDTWVIIDTGSNDDTMKIIHEELAGIPGQLLEREWVNFGHNRNELLDLARDAADYLILLDADIEVEIDHMDPLHDLSSDSYEVLVTGGLEYYFPYVIRSDFGWRYVGATHEYLSAPNDTTPVTARLTGIRFHHHGDGGAKADKFIRDLGLLEAELEQDPDNPRTLFYLAQTRQSLGDVSGALAAYRKRIEVGGWEEEIFWSMYQIGEIYRTTGDWANSVNAYLLAWDYRPIRIEPIFRASQVLRSLGAHQSAFALIARAKDLMNARDERLFVEKWMYEWGIDFELAINAWWVGERTAAHMLWNQLSTRTDLPSDYIDSIDQNMKLDK